MRNASAYTVRMCNTLVLDSRAVIARVDALLRGMERSRSWLARRLGENDMWLSRRFSGKTRLDLDDVPRLAAALGVDVCELVGPCNG